MPHVLYTVHVTTCSRGDIPGVLTHWYGFERAPEIRGPKPRASTVHPPDFMELEFVLTRSHVGVKIRVIQSDGIHISSSLAETPKRTNATP